MNAAAKTTVVELAGAVFFEVPEAKPLDLALHPGEIGYLRSSPIALELLGIESPAGGTVRFFAKTWQERSVAESEDARRLVGTVFDPGGPSSRTWISNLDVDENVLLASQLDPARGSAAAERHADELARRFGLPDGLPSGRPANTAPPDLLLSQWVRAFLRDPLALLILERPLDGAPAESGPVLRNAIAEALGAGTAVLWIDESPPSFLRLEAGGKAVLE